MIIMKRFMSFRPLSGSFFLFNGLNHLLTPEISFRPLSGSFFLFLNPKMLDKYPLIMFSSPVGVFLFVLMRVLLIVDGNQSFRPLSGSFFLFLKEAVCKTVDVMSFSSPVGVFLFVRSILHF